MRRSPFFRILAALVGVWFTYSYVNPPSDMAGMVTASGAPMTMGGMGASSTGDASAGSAHRVSATPTEAPSPAGVNHPPPEKSRSTPECDHRECCCSALSPLLLAPEASLAWLPEHVIAQNLPLQTDRVVQTAGQLLLPFANGPPNSVTA